MAFDSNVGGWTVAIALGLGAIGSCTGGDSDAGDAEDDGAAGASCPDSVPAADEPCPEPSMTCVYMACDTLGVATATCRDDGAWDVQTLPCAELDCAGQTCAPGFVCSISASGAIVGTCVENPCGEGPVDCDCLGCAADRCSASGLSITCNTCQAEVCP